MLRGHPMWLFKAEGEIATGDDSAATLLTYSTSAGDSSYAPLAESPPAHSAPTQGPWEGVRQVRTSTLGRGAECIGTQAAETSLVSASMEAQGCMQKPTKREIAEAELQQLRNKLLEDLQNVVGQRRAKALYSTHVCRSHFLLVHGDGQKEKTLAEELQRWLKEEGQMVEGPWSIIYGENELDAWQRLSSRAMAVIVLLSPALFQDAGLCRCLMEMQHSHPDTIAPLYLEPLSPQGLPPSLAFLSHTNGRVVPESHWNPHPFIRSLLKKCQRLRHFCREIEVLNTLVGELEASTDYVCPCGAC